MQPAKEDFLEKSTWTYLHWQLSDFWCNWQCQHLLCSQMFNFSC